MAFAKRPSRRANAPVNAPRSWPNSSASRMLSGMAAQLTATKGPDLRAECSWMKRASSSLPVPLSPRTRTVAEDGAACVAISRTRRRAGLDPTISCVVRRAISLLRERFSVTRLCRSAAFFTLFTMFMRLRGFSTKSYAPSRIAWTAVSTVP